MDNAAEIRVVLVTAPDLEVARALASVLLDRRLVACVNLVPGLESHYMWQGRLERSSEVMLVIKTTSSLLAAVEAAVLTHHPYDTPEILALTVSESTPKYLAWLLDSTAPR